MDVLLETIYSKIEKIHHKTLKVAYESNDAYDNILLQSNTVSVHLRFLMTEMYKSISQLNPEFMGFYFTHKNMLYSLRKDPTLNLTKNPFILLWYKCSSFSGFSHME